MTKSGYVFRPMNEEEARAVVSWCYEAPYDFYAMANDPEGWEELLGPPERRRGYYAVLSGGELAGFFCLGPGGQLPGFDYADGGSLDIGLGLKPDLTGRGLGLHPLVAPDLLDHPRVERAGFQRVTVFTHHTNGGGYPFLLMTREA
jgi:hypothetical protein